MDRKLFRRVIVACGCTAALTVAVACDNSTNQQRSSSSSPAAAPADKNASDNQPITLTGCLMRGDGHNDFVLTKANQPVGTSGEAAGAGSIPERTREAAERSYRLDGDNDQLNALIGHRVRVSGTIKDHGDLNASSDTSASNARGTSGEAGKNQEISESDLAKVDVKSIDSVADSCDGVNPTGAKQPAKSKPARR
jgi:hypothetical protein